MNIQNNSDEAADDRRIILAMNVSLDGYVGGPDGELDWLWPTLDPEMQGDVVDFLKTVDTVLIGHETYLGQAAQWPRQSDPIADLLNSHTKIVFSRRLQKLEWQNSQLAGGDVANVVAGLKGSPGKNIFVTGGALLAQTMSSGLLIDEYRLNIHPTILGSGKALFAGVPATASLQLLDTKGMRLERSWPTTRGHLAQVGDPVQDDRLILGGLHRSTEITADVVGPAKETPGTSGW